MNTRAKFTCFSVRKYRSDVWDNQTGHSTERFLYDYEFNAVSGNSDENKEFFASTPSGSIKLSAVRNDLFEPGKSYYLDFSPAE
jgi:hypothetical protein